MVEQEAFAAAHRRVEEAVQNFARVINEVSHETGALVIVKFGRLRTVGNEVAELCVDSVCMDRIIRYPHGFQVPLEPSVMTY